MMVTSVFAGILLVAFQKPDKKNSAQKFSIILALFAALLGGGNVIVQKLIAVGGHYLMGFLLTRIFMLGFMLTPVIRDRRTTRVSRSYRKLGLLGLIDVSAFFCWYIGLRIGLVSIVTPIATSSPAVTIVLAHIFLNERVRLHQRIGIVAIIAGIVILSAIS
jgi:transporter family protein